MPTQHQSISEDRWSRFPLDQQILMIGNEMNRAAKVLRHEDRSYRNNCYERILHLTDLTIRVQQRAALRRELLRWRDLIAELYVSLEPDGQKHDAAFRSLLMLTPVSSEQLPHRARA
jgi:hypothetical protein